MKTATEKYNAVLEGKADKKEFVRQMRQQFPILSHSLTALTTQFKSLKIKE